MSGLSPKVPIFHFQDCLEIEYFHQAFQVPKMEGFRTNLIKTAFLGVGKLPRISLIHTAYIGEDSSILGT